MSFYMICRVFIKLTKSLTAANSYHIIIYYNPRIYWTLKSDCALLYHFQNQYMNNHGSNYFKG